MTAPDSKKLALVDAPDNEVELYCCNVRIAKVPSLGDRVRCAAEYGEKFLSGIDARRAKEDSSEVGSRHGEEDSSDVGPSLAELLIQSLIQSFQEAFEPLHNQSGLHSLPSGDTFFEHPPPASTGLGPWRRWFALNTFHGILTHVMDHRGMADCVELRHLRYSCTYARYDAALKVLSANKPSDNVCIYMSQAAWAWISLLTTDGVDEQFFLSKFKVDRERMVKKALFRDNGAVHRALAPTEHERLFSQEDRYRAIFMIVRRWFLPRFDLAGARACLKATVHEQREVQTGAKFPQVFGFSDKFLGYKYWAAWTTVLLVTVGSVFPSLPYANGLVGAGMTLPLLHGLVVFADSALTGLPMSLPLAPRLIAGVAVGALFLASLAEPISSWLARGGAELWVTGIGACIMMYAGTYFYFLSEVRRNATMLPSHGKRDRRAIGAHARRAFTVWWIGLAYSLVAAAWISATLAGPKMLKARGGADAADDRLFSSAFGLNLPVLPEFVFVGSAVVLLGAIALQMVWDKSVTTDAPP